MLMLGAGIASWPAAPLAHLKAHKGNRDGNKDTVNPNCERHWLMSPNVGHLPDTATMVPAFVTLNGAKIGRPVDGTTKKTSCDQIVALGVADGLVRGTSSLVGMGFSLGFIGTVGERIKFKYWNALQKQEYDVQFQYTMEAGGFIGGFASPKELVLSQGKGVLSQTLLSSAVSS